MKIVHLIHNFPPEFRGGTEIYLHALCKEQIKAEHDVSVICGSETRKWCDNFEAGEYDGIPLQRFFRLPQGEEFTVDNYLERFEGLLIDYLENRRPDIVHLHHWMNLSNRLLSVAAEVSIPSVATLHDLYSLCPRFFMVNTNGEACRQPCPQEDCLSCGIPSSTLDDQMKLEGEFRIRNDNFKEEFAAAGELVVPSKSHAVPFIKSGLLKKNEFRILHHGLTQAVAQPVWKLNKDKPLKVGLWGNLVHAKGVHVLLGAVKTGGEDLIKNVEVHLYGDIIDPEYEEKLKVASNGLNVTFHGNFTGLALDEMCKDLDLAVFPSLARESYSMVLDEAIALGVPVIVSDAGALPERVGKGGIVVPAGDEISLADQLLRLENDRSLLQDLSNAIRKMGFSIEDNSKEVEKIYKKVVAIGATPVPNRSQIRRTALLKGRIEMLCHQRDERDGSVLLFNRFREFTPIRDFASLPTGDVLIIAPHPDDEVIGCGGAIALHSQRGDNVTVVQLTDGARGGDGKCSGSELADVRNKEAETAGKILGVKKVISLGYEDGKLLPDPATVDSVHLLVKALKPAAIYCPSSFEIHPDHIAALFIALNLLERDGDLFSLFMYEVNEVMTPGFIIDITPVKEKKDQALACFESQIRLNDVRDKSMSGARWRTANVDLPEITHAEAYIEAGKKKLRGLIARTKELVSYIEKGL